MKKSRRSATKASKFPQRRAVASLTQRSRQPEAHDPYEQAIDFRPTIERRAVEPLTPKTETQRRYINAIRNFQLTFGLGPAGTGKTYIAGAIACEMFEAREVERIIITRPAVEAGESLGFLPGELDEKYEPYLQPLRAVFNERFGRGMTDYLIKSKKIEPMPLAYMRGMTFSNCIVILDEAQNVSPVQMKMFLTRIGMDCTVIVNGDLDQKDIPGPSGLEEAVRRIAYIPSVKVVKFDAADIVRSGLVSEIVAAYSKPLPELHG